MPYVPQTVRVAMTRAQALIVAHSNLPTSKNPRENEFLTEGSFRLEEMRREPRDARVSAVSVPGAKTSVYPSPSRPRGCHSASLMPHSAAASASDGSLLVGVPFTCRVASGVFVMSLMTHDKACLTSR